MTRKYIEGTRGGRVQFITRQHATQPGHNEKVGGTCGSDFGRHALWQATLSKSQVAPCRKWKWNRTRSPAVRDTAWLIHWVLHPLSITVHVVYRHFSKDSDSSTLLSWIFENQLGQPQLSVSLTLRTWSYKRRCGLNHSFPGV